MKTQFARILGTALLACLSFTSCGGEDTATVKRVIDGDTIEVEYQGQDATVRLLNIDTPETKHPNKIVECLGPEASQFLTDMLPEGTPVTLEFDKEKTDKYDRLLAGVFKEDGTFVNEAIAKNGFANAIKIAPRGLFIRGNNHQLDNGPTSSKKLRINHHKYSQSQTGETVAPQAYNRP